MLHTSWQKASALWKPLQEGLILPITEGYQLFIQPNAKFNTDSVANPIYRFLHHLFQQAAYAINISEKIVYNFQRTSLQGFWIKHCKFIDMSI